MTDPALPHLPVTSSEALALARIEVKLDNALESQKEHKSTLDRHDKAINDHGTRLTKLETLNQADDTHQARSYSGKAVMWTAIGAVCAVAAVLMAVLLAVRGGS